MAENCVEIILIDCENQIEHTLILNAEDAESVKTDIAFAATLLRQAQQVHAAQMIAIERNAFTDIGELSSVSLIPDEQEDTNDIRLVSPILEQNNDVDDTQPEAYVPINNQEEGLCNWTAPMCLLLLSTYKENELNFTSGKMSQKHAWEIITKAMMSENYIVSGPKCNSKFTSMKRTYKSIKDHNSKTGNERKTWPYLQQMDEMFAKKPWVKPVATASSTTFTQEPTSNSEEDTDSSKQLNKHMDSSSKKRKNSTADYLLELVVEKKKKIRKDREQQHEEKMKEVRKINILLEKMYQSK